MASNAYLSHPSIFKDSITFCTDDDLWTVNVEGGLARRLTTKKGIASSPHVSPDGEWIAYLCNDHGQFDVYLSPRLGGLSERLTYCSGIAIGGWRDSDTLIVSSSKGSFSPRHRELFSVDIHTKQMTNLGLGPASHIVTHEKTSVIGKNLGDPARWKRYRGGTAGTLWIDRQGSGRYQQMLKNLPTNISNPCFIDGRLFFLSDHEGVANIYSVPASGRGAPRRHSHQEEYYVRRFSHSNGMIAYQCGAEIWSLDLKAGEERPVPIEVRSSFNQATPRYENASQFLRDIALSPDADEVALTTRGKLYAMAPWSGAPVALGKEHHRYKNPVYLGDDIVAVELNDEREETLVLFDESNLDGMHIMPERNWGKISEVKADPKGKYLAFATNRNQVWIVDIKRKRAFLQEENKHFHQSGLNWSPDGRYLVYASAIHRQKKGIKIVDIATRKGRFLIDPVLDDSSPAFSTCGKYLYFVGMREFHPVYNETHFDLGFPFGSRVYAIVLSKDTPSPLELYLDFDQEGDAEEDKENKSKKDKKKEELVKIDFDGIESRIIRLPFELGGHIRVEAIRDKVFAQRIPVQGIDPLNGMEDHAPPNLLSFCLKEKKVECFEEGVDDFNVAPNGKYILMQLDDELRLVGTESKPNESDSFNRKDGFINLDRIRMRVSPTHEWFQMYQEAWILQREHHWMEDMSKIDWENVYIRYLPLLEKVHTRAEFSDLMWEMQGELGTSHCYEMYGDYHRKAPRNQNGFLGASLRDHGSLVEIDKVYQGDSWIPGVDSPLAAPQVHLRPGDIILEVDGIPVDSVAHLEEQLEGKAGIKVNLSVQRKGKHAPENVCVKTLFQEYNLRYREWVEENKEYVHNKSDGKLGYVHIPNMSIWGYSEFYRNYLSECIHEGLIVDVRYNGGGNVSQHILKILAQKMAGFDKTRWYGVEPYPMYAINGPIVAVTNEHAGSDGDIFSHTFKLLEIGKLIGKRTWGGVVGIWPRHDLNDGTYTSQPEFSFWFKDTGFSVENYGTDPDIEVDILPQHWKQGIDTQLDKAIEVALKEYKRNPPLIPDFTKAPDLSPPRLPRI